MTPDPMKSAKRNAWVLRNIPQPFDPETAINKFTYRPRVGDVWEVKLPHRSKKTKTVGRVRLEWFRRTKYGVQQDFQLPYVDWDRANKGRYTGIRVKWLIKYGKLTHRLVKM